MAATLKCTKITNKGESLVVTGAYTVKVDYTNPGTSPPTPGSVQLEIPTLDMEDFTIMQDDIDNALLLIGSNSMNWAL